MIIGCHGLCETGRKTFSSRGLFDRESVKSWLDLNPNLIDLPAGLERDEAIVVTIDDSTNAAADLTQELLDRGQPATIFVNGSNIERERDYHFCRLNVLCDRLLNRYEYEVVEDVRLRAKYEMSLRRSEHGRHAVVDRLAAAFKESVLKVPRHLRTMSKPRLLELHRQGAVIANHGFTHGNLQVLDARQYLRDVELGFQWIEETIGVRPPRIFAPPYGRALPPSPASVVEIADVILLDEKRQVYGWIGSGIYNRFGVDSLVELLDHGYE